MSLDIGVDVEGPRGGAAELILVHIAEHRRIRHRALKGRERLAVAV